MLTFAHHASLRSHWTAHQYHQTLGAPVYLPCGESYTSFILDNHNHAGLWNGNGKVFVGSSWLTTYLQIYTAILVFVTQKLAMRRNLRAYQTLTATHDNISSWMGLGSALATLIPSASGLFSHGITQPINLNPAYCTNALAMH